MKKTIHKISTVSLSRRSIAILAAMALLSPLTLQARKDERTAPDVNVESLATNGLLIGNVEVSSFQQNTALAGVHYDPGIKRIDLESAGVAVNRVAYFGAITDGKIKLVLPPGKYTLNAIVGGTFKGDWRGYYSIDRTFTIEAGRVTSLGTALFLFSDKSDSKKYSYHFIDTGREALDYLKIDSPGVYAAVSKKPTLKVQGKYLDTGEMAKARRVVSYYSLRSALNAEDSAEPRAQKYYTFGVIGTLARVVRDPKTRQPLFIPINTGTFASLDICSTQLNRVACVMKYTDRVLLYNGKKVSYLQPEPGFVPTNILVYDESGIVVSDDEMRIRYSSDNGKSWFKYEDDYSRKKSGWRQLARIFHYPMVRFYRSKKGWYAVSSRSGARVISFDRSTANITALNLPSKAKFPVGIFETGTGIVLGPEFTPPPTVFVRKNGEEEWKKVKVTRGTCGEIARSKKNPSVLQSNCVSNKGWGPFESDDEGLTWKKSTAWRSYK